MMAGSHVVVGVVAWAWAAPHLGFPALDPVALALAIGGARCRISITRTPGSGAGLD